MQNSQLPPKKIFIYVFIPVLLTLIASAIVNLQLFQDGGSYLFEIVQINSAAIRHNRISVVLIQLPTIFFMKLVRRFPGGIDEHLSLIRIVFSLSYSLIPFLALLFSWFVVRKRNESLFIWTVLIILFINLVNFSGVSELLISIQLSCPLMLASILIPRTRFFWVSMVILLPFIFFLHPLVAVLFITMAIGNVYVGYKRPEIRSSTWRNAMILVAAGISKFILDIYSLSTYESSFLEKKGMNEYILDTSIENIFLLVVSMIIGAGILINKYKNNFRIRSVISTQRIYLFLIGLAIIACLLSVFQYSYQEFPLKTGLSIVASLIIFFMMAFDSAEKIVHAESVQRFRLVTILAILFSLVVFSKAFVWQLSIQKLRQSISRNESPCLELSSSDFKWLNSNPYKIINTWALPSLALIEQNNNPRKLLLEEGSCKIYRESGSIRFDQWSIIPKQYITLALQKQ
jgi:hypothetical protein